MEKNTIIFMQCRGVGCHQGRLPCPHPEQCQPEAAEACSEIGSEDCEKARTTFWWLYATAVIVAVTILVSCLPI